MCIMIEIENVKKDYANDPLFLEVMHEALSIQDRFAAEPIYAKTGKGYLKSVGVAELADLKKQLKRATKQK